MAVFAEWKVLQDLRFLWAEDDAEVLLFGVRGSVLWVKRGIFTRIFWAEFFSVNSLRDKIDGG